MGVKYLPYQTRMQVACYCAARQAGWINSTIKGVMVCSHCAKPSPPVVLRICMWCEEQFILDRQSKRWKPLRRYLPGIGAVTTEVACFTCEPEQD